MSENWEKYRRNFTILFFISLVGLGVHALDDAFVTREPDWYAISAAEFLFYVALIYLVVPPIGLWLARRGRLIGLTILALYAFQAFYGAGLNHVRHLSGNFQGSQLLPLILNSLGVNYGAWLKGRGFLPVLMNMAGLGTTPPHSHTLLSNLVVFSNIAINLTLMAYLALAAREWWKTSAASPAKA